jgi:dethiobiotin synthetase
MKGGFFVTGTDTGVGKTVVSLGLMRILQERGRVVAGMKPVASGCRLSETGLINDDAFRLQAQASITLDYDRVNPYAFEPPIAPHLAAAAQGVGIEVPVIRGRFRDIAARADAVIVEGVGGWLVPINSRQTMADVARALSLPVVMVVAIRLGCLNHALLTAAAIQQSGLRLAGWVANRIDPGCSNTDDIVAALSAWLSAPQLADIPCQSGDAAPESALRLTDPDVLAG